MHAARRPATAVLAAVTVALSACGGAATPQEQLEEAVSATADTSFAYSFTVDADAEALAGLTGEGGGQVGAFLQSFEVSGASTGEAIEMVVGVLGIDAVQVRAFGEEATYVRLGIDELGAMMGADPTAQLAPFVAELEQRGLSREAAAAVEAALAGRWVGVEGRIDPAQLRDLFGAGGATEMPDEQQLRDALGGDLQGFIERYIAVESVSDTDGAQRFAVQLQLRELMRAFGEATGQQADLEADLADVPETVPGTVTVRDGLVTSLVIDAAEVARAQGEDVTGSVELRLDLSEHGEIEQISRPEDVVTISAEQLAEALRLLVGTAGASATAEATFEATPIG